MLNEIMRNGMTYFCLILFALCLHIQESKAMSCRIDNSRYYLIGVGNDSIDTNDSIDDKRVYELKSELKKQKGLEKQSSLLSDSLKSLEKVEKELIGKHNSLTKEIEKKKKAKEKLTNSKNNLNYKKLVKEKDSLAVIISKRVKEIARKQSDINNLKEQLKQREHRKTQLVNVQKELSEQLVAKYNGYVESTFSLLSIDSLRKIAEECRPFTFDKNIDSFVVKIEGVIRNKGIYDSSTNVLNSKYNEYEVTHSLTKLSQQTYCSEVQLNELVTLKEQLGCFKDGLAAFKEFINNLNEKRKDVSYSLDYYNDDKSFIISKELQEKIDNKLYKVPYLKKQYDGFMAEFEKDPNCHSEIEKEILGQ